MKTLYKKLSCIFCSDCNIEYLEERELVRKNYNPTNHTVVESYMWH